MHLIMPYSPECVEKLSDNSKRGSLWTLEVVQNGARSAVSVPSIPPEAGAQGYSNDLSDSFWKARSRKFA